MADDMSRIFTLRSLKFFLIGSGTLSALILLMYQIFFHVSLSTLNRLDKPGTDSKSIGKIELEHVNVALLPSKIISGKNLDKFSISNPQSKTQIQKENEGQISAVATHKVISHDTSYTVLEGDSLASIAEKMYGDTEAWTLIAQANGIHSPDEIEIGMKLRIPRTSK